MSMKQALRIVGAVAAGAAALTAAGSAMAGRCGHSYPVDRATTLSEVARQCNVSLAALREANPGVDPGNVRPGEHLAVPDEIDAYYARGASGPAYRSRTQDADIDYSRDIVAIRDDEGFDAINAAYETPYSESATARFRDQRNTAGASWLDEQAGGVRHHSSVDRLSYQKLSALRIQTAGRSLAPATNVVGAPVQSTLVSCPVLQNKSGQSIEKLRNIVHSGGEVYVEIESRPNGAPSSCTLINASEPAMLTPGVPLAHFGLPSGGPGRRVVMDGVELGVLPSAFVSAEPNVLALSGDIVQAGDGCAVLADDNGELWRLTSLKQAEELFGRKVRVWGEMTAGGGACGEGLSFSVSHTVYAEPWR